MKLIVGLGNPGKEYEHTRHNIGFMVIDRFNELKALGTFKEKFNGLFINTVIDDKQVIFLKPLSYMNLSGDVVSKFAKYFKIKLEDILIIHDDLDMPTGKIKLKVGGSSGGHNGIKDISSKLNSEMYKHLKIGIANNKLIDTKDYVLSRFLKEEEKLINDAVNLSTQILNDYLNLDFSDLMTKYNGANNGLSS